jgi:hypothetical protein
MAYICPPKGKNGCLPPAGERSSTEYLPAGRQGASEEENINECKGLCDTEFERWTTLCRHV